MFTNFHTHTYLCGHAEGWIPDYVEAATRVGCRALGFSDHCPYPAGDSRCWPEIRMTADEAEFYVNGIRLAASGSDFPIYVGFECEYDKRYYSWYKDELRGRWQADYLVFGPHWVANQKDFPYVPTVTTKKEVHAYFDGVIEGIESGLFNFVAHPDLIMASGRDWSDDLAACFSHVIDAAMAHNLPLEINGLGNCRTAVKSREGIRQPYPYYKFWELVKEKGATVVCNADAHRPQDMAPFVESARSYAKKFGITPIEDIFSV